MRAPLVAILAAIAAAACASAAIARDQVHPSATTNQTANQTGWGVVLAASSTKVTISGLPLDVFLNPFPVRSRHGLELSLGPVTTYASARVCKQRLQKCPLQTHPGWQWIPVSGSLLRPHDQVMVIFAVSTQAANGDVKAGRPVPALTILDYS